jgi:hypothetical protein
MRSQEKHDSKPGALDSPRSMPASFWLFLVWLVALAFSGLALRFPLPLPQCGLLTITGIPCPLCGSTRTLAALSNLDFALAFSLNPLVAGGSVAIFFWFCLWLLGRRLKLDWTGWLWRQLARLPLLPLFAAAVIANWLYLFFCLPR